MNACQLTLLTLVFTGTALAADAPAPPSAVDPTAEAVAILQAKYPDFKDLQVKAGDHLADLITRSGGKISLRPGNIGALDANPPIVTTTLPDYVLYWRLASFKLQQDWTHLATELAEANKTGLGMIVDLRSNANPDDYQGAAQALGLLEPSDRTLSTYQTDGSGHPILRFPDNPFHLPIVVLVDGSTNGAAEALAVCLKADGALVIGQATAGRIGVFAEQPLSGGQVLRYLTAPLGTSNPVKADDHSLAWDQPVLPDVGLMANERMEKGALVLIKDNHILDLIQESPPRHRLSEAALVQGIDPEWDAYLVTLEKKDDDHFLLSLPPIRDPALIAALDNLKAIQLSQRPPIIPTQPAAHPAAAASLQ